MKKTLLMLSVCLFLVNCAKSSQTFTPDGNFGHVIDCSGPFMSWNNCYKKSGDICGERGYKILDKSTESGVQSNSSGFAETATQSTTTMVTRSLMVECNN